MPEFRVTTVRGSPDRVVIVGEADLATAPEIGAELAGLSRDVLVDCSGLTFIDSAGFDAFDRGYHAAETRGSAFAVSGLSSCATRIGQWLSVPYLPPDASPGWPSPEPPVAA